LFQQKIRVIAATVGYWKENKIGWRDARLADRLEVHATYDG
jgi:hypothetical protein